MDQLPILAARIRARRKHLHLDQSELAQMIGSRQSTVSNWELGTPPRADSLLKLTEALDVSLDYLFGLTSVPHGKAGELTDDEKELLQTYRAAHQKGEILRVVQALAGSSKE